MTGKARSKVIGEIGVANACCIPLVDESVDLGVMSPPYDELRDYKGYKFFYGEVIAELYRVTKPGGVIVWVVGDQVIDGSESGTSFKQALEFMRVGFKLFDTMIYEKSGMSFPDPLRYMQSFEYMFVFSKGMPKTRNLIKDRKNAWAGTQTFGTFTQRAKDGSLKEGYKRTIKKISVRRNIWQIKSGFGYTTKDEKAYKHPAVFPEQLARDHIISWSNPGDLVLDPMCGSGTTCKVAKELGRQYVGFDISFEYATLAQERTAGANPPLPLFT